MARGFSIMDMMSEISREGAAAEAETIERVSVFDIQPNEDNFYKISSIEQLKNSIYAMGGVQQNLLLAELPAGSSHKYKLLSGHRRTRACIELVQEGHKEFEYVPAVIRKGIGKDTEDMLLIMTNSTLRELTDWEKVMQHMKLKEIIPKLKKRQGLDGRARALEADYLGVSEAQIAIYNTVGTRLEAQLMNMLKNGSIGISLAYEAAKLEPELQKELGSIALSKGRFTEDDIKGLISDKPIKGQLKIAEEENVSESSTFEETLAAVENVSESSTFEEPPAAVENVSESDTSEGPLAAAVENVSESSTFEKPSEAAAVKNVSESDTSEEHPAAAGNAGENSGIKFRGGYEPVLIDDMIKQYESYLEIAVPEKLQNQICKYNCLLDALELLRGRLAQEEGVTV